MELEMVQRFNVELDGKTIDPKTRWLIRNADNSRTNILIGAGVNSYIR